MSTSGSAGAGSATSAARSSLEMGQSNQELLSKSKTKFSRRNLIILAGGCAVILAVVLILIFTLGQSDDAPGKPEESVDPRPPFELDDYLNGKFSSKRFNGTWISDTQIMYRNAEGSVLFFDVFSGESTVQLTPADAPILNESFMQQISADGKYLLLGYAYEKLYRHTFLANYMTVNLETKQSTNITGPDGTPRLQLVKWAPKGNSYVFVQNNNIYYKLSADSKDNIVRGLTINGENGIIYNGVPDWVYEEEVFGSNEAVWFSADGKRLAYAHFDDSNVHTMSFPWYGEASNFAFQYPLKVDVKYPKPGTPNPIIKLFTVDLTKAEAGDAMSIQVPVPPEVGADHILTAVTWSTANEVISVWMNRVQTKFVIAANGVATPSPGQNLYLHEESLGWVELFEAPRFSTDGTKMLIIMPHEQENEIGRYRHLTMITRQQGGNAFTTALTKGKFVVTSITAWDQTNNIIYFLATSDKDPAQQNLYSISGDGSSEMATCLSCDIKVKPERATCTYVSASFSPEQSYFVLNCNGPDIPGAMIYKKGLELVKVWEANDELAAFMNAHSAPSKKRQYVEVPNGMQAYTQLLLPPDMDTSGNTKYPMLINVYGGPDSVQVSDRWVGDWGTYLTTNRNIIYAAIDGRGSGLKGNNVLFAGFRNLGTVEIEDQINVAKDLQNLLPYIDKNRTAIWGWSYGGYSTGMALAKDLNGVFRCGMSVAPVTDWIYYDSIYTERYMGLPTPDDNLVGYAAANLNIQVDNLGRNEDRFLLIHGNADDNVHYQQSMILSKVLERKDILFRQQSYPDEAHGLNGVTPHLYHTLEKFLDECLDLPKRT